MIEREEYLKAKSIVSEYEKQMTPLPPKPTMPLSRVVREGCSKFCSNCGSTESRNGFLGIFGKLVCHNNECKNSK